MQAMNRILQPAFYEFRGHRSEDPTPWGSGFEQSVFIDNLYTLSGLDLMFLGSENDFVRIGMVSHMVDYTSRSPVLLMKELFDRYDCARAIRFTSYLPSDISPWRFDNLISLRDWMLRNMGDERSVEAHCCTLNRCLQFEFDVEFYYRKIDGEMRCSPCVPHREDTWRTFHYPAVRFDYHTPEQVGLSIDTSDYKETAAWGLPHEDILHKLQGLCEWRSRLASIHVFRPENLPKAMNDPLSELVEAFVSQRRGECREPEWETTDRQQIEIRLELNPKSSQDPFLTLLQTSDETTL